MTDNIDWNEYHDVENIGIHVLWYVFSIAWFSHSLHALYIYQQVFVSYFETYISHVYCQRTRLPYSHQHFTLIHHWPLTLAKPRADHIQHGTCIVTQARVTKLTRQRLSCTSHIGRSRSNFCAIVLFHVQHNTTDLAHTRAVIYAIRIERLDACYHYHMIQRRYTYAILGYTAQKSFQLLFAFTKRPPIYQDMKERFIQLCSI